MRLAGLVPHLIHQHNTVRHPPPNVVVVLVFQWGAEAELLAAILFELLANESRSVRCLLLCILYKDLLHRLQHHIRTLLSLADLCT